MAFLVHWFRLHCMDWPSDRIEDATGHVFAPALPRYMYNSHYFCCCILWQHSCVRAARALLPWSLDAGPTRAQIFGDPRQSHSSESRPCLLAFSDYFIFPTSSETLLSVYCGISVGPRPSFLLFGRRGSNPGAH